MPSDQDILDLWETNSHNWAKAVRGRASVRRRSGTDEAILNEIASLAPKRLLDVGCGEGWLVRDVQRRLSSYCLGVDGSRRLIEYARRADPKGSYSVASYQSIVEGALKDAGMFDIVVFNFALFGAEIVPLLKEVRNQMNDDGTLLIQTVHPWMVQEKDGYHDGWYRETFAGYEGTNWKPVPYYLRRIESWSQALWNAGLVIGLLKEPLDSRRGYPLSLLLRCRKLGS